MRESFNDSPYEAHVWADDSNKGGSDRHVVGIHTWNKLTEKPEAYILGYSLMSSGSGKDQAKAVFHVVSKQFGITNERAMIGDNAKTQTGNKQVLVNMNNQLFDKEMFSMGCYPHVLNIVIRRACQSAFGYVKYPCTANALQNWLGPSSKTRILPINVCKPGHFGKSTSTTTDVGGNKMGIPS